MTFLFELRVYMTFSFELITFITFPNLLMASPILNLVANKFPFELKFANAFVLKYTHDFLLNHFLPVFYLSKVCI